MKAATTRFAEAARASGLEIRITTHAQSTRTADEAASACSCPVGAIVKSLVFKGKTSGTPFLLLVSGANRVDEKRVAATIGEALVRPDATFVRDVTGYAIGGIPPLGHDRKLQTYIDRDLLAYERVWAAAGTPDSVFDAAPHALAMATNAIVIEVT